MTELEVGIHATVAMQCRDRYLRIPFDLPDGTTSFEVRLTVQVADGVVVDLGCEGPDGWKGWSGGARRSFVIGRNDATPGYLPGGLRAGRWHVVLGLHILPRDGVDLRVTVTTPAIHTPDHGPAEHPARRSARGSDRELPAPAGLRWYAGDMHAHSLHSDGDLSLWELANEAVLSGLDFLFVTDHNTTSHHEHLRAVGERHNILLLPGQEVTTHAGHANAYGDIGFVDFRLPAQTWVDCVEERGGLLSINHPVSGDCSWLHQLTCEPGGVELYHGSWYMEPAARSALAWFQRWRRDVTLLGGSDFHGRSTPHRPGMPTTWVAAEECSPGAILDGMRAGRTTITASATLQGGVGRPVHEGSPILIRQGESLLVMAGAGLALVSNTNQRRMIGDGLNVVTAPLLDGPYRLEDSQRLALALCR